MILLSEKGSRWARTWPRAPVVCRRVRGASCCTQAGGRRAHRVSSQVVRSRAMRCSCSLLTLHGIMTVQPCGWRLLGMQHPPQQIGCIPPDTARLYGVEPLGRVIMGLGIVPDLRGNRRSQGETTVIIRVPLAEQ